MTVGPAFQGYPLVLLIIIIALLVLLALLWSRLRRTPDGPKPEQPQHHFATGQLGLLADHSPGLQAEQIARLAQADPIVQQQLIERYDAYIPADRIATFQRDGRAFSLIPVEVPPLRQEDRLLGVVKQLNAQIEPPDPIDKPPIDGQNGERPSNGDKPKQRSNGALAQGSLTLRLATPNWLAGGTPEPDGSGSPGARPRPPAINVLNQLRAAAGQGLRQFAPPPPLQLDLPCEEWGSGVDVYILDTAPCTIDIERAYQRWSGSNRLIASLLRTKPDRPLEISYAGYSHLLEQADFYHPQHNYVMSDHGLFVASIIHAIAPKARLHLIEVLNPYGVGTLTSIASGFAQAADGITATSKRVVNASLGLEVPNPRADWLDYIREHDAFWSTFSEQDIAKLVAPLEQICGLFEYPEQDQFGQPNRYPYVGVVAAAGNDRTPQSPWPPARFPAAHPSVLGVGALKRDGDPAEYSNRSDSPISDGVATFGGDSQGIDSHQSNGVVGAYIGAFPNGSENRDGLASWAGTSFATPRISGAIAALMSGGHTFASAIKELREIVNDPLELQVGDIV